MQRAMPAARPGREGAAALSVGAELLCRALSLLLLRVRQRNSLGITFEGVKSLNLLEVPFPNKALLPRPVKEIGRLPWLSQSQ